MENEKSHKSKKIFSFLILACIVLLIVLFALISGSDINISPKSLKISHKSKDENVELRHKIENLEKKNKELKNLGISHKSKDENLEKRNKELENKDTKFFLFRESIKYSYYFLERNKINTNYPVNSELRQFYYHHIQIIMSAIGNYEGPFGGDQKSTNSVVREFQRIRNLYIDGIIGKKTLKEIRKLLIIKLGPL